MTLDDGDHMGTSSSGEIKTVDKIKICSFVVYRKTISLPLQKVFYTEYLLVLTSKIILEHDFNIHVHYVREAFFFSDSYQKVNLFSPF